MVEDTCLSFSSGNGEEPNECFIQMKSIECPDYLKKTRYVGSIIQASPVYQLKVESDVRNRKRSSLSFKI